MKMLCARIFIDLCFVVITGAETTAISLSVSIYRLLFHFKTGVDFVFRYYAKNYSGLQTTLMVHTNTTRKKNHTEIEKCKSKGQLNVCNWVRGYRQQNGLLLVSVASASIVTDCRLPVTHTHIHTFRPCRILVHFLCVRPPCVKIATQRIRKSSKPRFAIDCISLSRVLFWS